MIQLLAALVLPCHSAPVVRVEAVRAAPALAAPAAAAPALAAPAAKSGAIPGFIYPEQMRGAAAKADIPWVMTGRGTHEGHVSVFNLARRTAESLLPTQFALAETGSDEHPVVVVWGRISGAAAGPASMPIPSPLSYREWQLYVPGVYRKDRDHSELRTYVPRIYVDAFLPEFLGRKFFYKKIQLPGMLFDGRRMSTGGIVEMEAVDGGWGPRRTWERMRAESREWRAVLSWLPESDIMGESGPGVPPRYSAFRWDPLRGSVISTGGEVVMRIHKTLTPGMETELLHRPIRSVASFALNAWHFYVNNDYEEGR